MPAAPDGEAAKLERAIRRRFGSASRIEAIEIPSLGGSNRTIIFDLVEGAARRRLVSRQETYSGSESPFLSTAHQFRVMQLAHRHDIPVPVPEFEYDAADGLGDGYVTRFVPGETMPKRILTDASLEPARGRLAVQAADVLARLHAIPTESLGFLAGIPDSRDPLAAQRARYESYREPHPAIEAGLRWLDRHRPANPPPRLLHGDFRTGNLMVDEHGLVALLDWECAHLGDPLEDLGWLCMRSWRFMRPALPVGGFGERSVLYAGYRHAGGDAVDDAGVRYWEVFGLVRWAVLNMMQAWGHAEGGRRGVVYAACGRNTALVEYDLLMTLLGHYE